MTNPSKNNLTRNKPKQNLSVSEMIKCYNNLNSSNAGSSGTNSGGQGEVREGRSLDLPGRSDERLRDESKSEITTTQLLLTKTGAVATNNFKTFSTVDSVLTNEERRFSKP